MSDKRYQTASQIFSTWMENGLTQTEAANMLATLQIVASFKAQDAALATFDKVTGEAVVFSTR